MTGKPAAPHGDGMTGGVGLARMQMLAQLAAGAASGSVPGRRTRRAAGRRCPPPPAKRKKSGRPAPVYQIKVGLRGAKPPIWRRLEVPADISLARLHTVIQIAFGWDDSHLHVFETPYGDFGTADADLGHRAETRVTLEQVAPAVNSKLRYTYDFGDDWDHDILVEKVLDHDGTTPYPRCTGGRRAAPPDDCGGIWGYAELVEVLQRPRRPGAQRQAGVAGTRRRRRVRPRNIRRASCDPGVVPSVLTPRTQSGCSSPKRPCAGLLGPAEGRIPRLGGTPPGILGRRRVRAIHLASLDKTRPVLVLTREPALGRLRTITVAAIISTIRGLATEVPVGPSNGLDHPSVVNLDNVFTIDQRSLGRRVGYLLDDQEPALFRAVINAFDLDD